MSKLQIVSQNGKYAIRRIGRFRTMYLERCSDGEWVRKPNSWCWSDLKDTEQMYNHLVDLALGTSANMPIFVMKSIDL